MISFVYEQTVTSLTCCSFFCAVGCQNVRPNGHREKATYEKQFGPLICMKNFRTTSSATNACATEGVTPRHLPSGTSTPSWKYMNAEGFAQVPDLDEQLNSPSTAVNALRQHASSFDDDMYAHQFNKQTPYLGQDGSLPQHFMQGVPDMNAGQSFPLGRSTPSVNMFTTVKPPCLRLAPIRPTSRLPAQAAAGRLQRASARQAAKAAQQQKRQAQSRASASTKKGSIAGTKRKKDEVAMEEEEEDDDGGEEILTTTTLAPGISCEASRNCEDQVQPRRR